MCYARRQRSSWARIKLSNKLYIFILSDDETFLFEPFLALLTFLSMSLRFTEALFFSKKFEISHLLVCLYLFSCCSIVNDQSSLAFAERLDYYTTFSLTCQVLFQKFFKKLFSRLASSIFGGCLSSFYPLDHSLDIIPPFLPFVKVFFNKIHHNFLSVFCHPFGIWHKKHSLYL